MKILARTVMNLVATLPEADITESKVDEKRTLFTLKGSNDKAYLLLTVTVEPKNDKPE